MRISSMNRLNDLAGYFRRKDIENLKVLCRREAEENEGVPRMCPSEIKLACLQNEGGYDSPDLNDKLYLHFRAFRKIENLTPYKNLKALWLDSNSISKIEGLETCQQLRCLFLSKNVLSGIGGLSSLKQLTKLDVSYNRIAFISGLSECTALQNLNISHNAIRCAESLEHLTLCEKLQTIDAINNSIEDSDDVIEVFAKISNLVSLSVTGNKCTQLPSFRKRMIANVRRLSYLDRPVEELERVGAVAFVAGGAREETKARDAYKTAAAEMKKNERTKFREWRQAEKLKWVAAASSKKVVFGPEEIAQRGRQAKIDAANERKWVFGQLHDWTDSVETENGSAELEDLTNEAKVVNHVIDDNINTQLEVETSTLENMDLEEEKLIEIIDEPRDEINAIIQSDSCYPDHVINPETHSTGETLQQAIDLNFSSKNIVSDSNINCKSPMTVSIEEKKIYDYRAKLVSDSLKQMKSQNQQPSVIASRGTWDGTAFPADVSLRENNQNMDVFYWNESLDEELRKLVESCEFNFALIALSLKESCKQGCFGTLQTYVAEEIDADVCRKRFGYLESIGSHQ